jgi:hypothetical protein
MALLGARIWRRVGRESATRQDFQSICMCVSTASNKKQLNTTRAHGYWTSRMQDRSGSEPVCYSIRYQVHLTFHVFCASLNKETYLELAASYRLKAQSCEPFCVAAMISVSLFISVPGMISLLAQ